MCGGGFEGLVVLFPFFFWGGVIVLLVVPEERDGSGSRGFLRRERGKMMVVMIVCVMFLSFEG